MKDIWPENVNWDDILSDEFKDIWLQQVKELDQLKTVAFPRQTINDSEPANMYMFTDASCYLYGFCLYSRQFGTSNLVFSKSKIAPTPKKSLPTLELLSVYLGLKCLPDILESIPHSIIDTRTIASDAQVVINWILSETIKTKNVFAKNRLKDILIMIKDIQEKFKIKISFKFVPSELNVADMLTRPMSYKKFIDNIDFWTRGPNWLNQPVVN